MLEKLFLSDHIESASLSAAACRALTLAIQATGSVMSLTVLAKPSHSHNLSFSAKHVSERQLNNGHQYEIFTT